MCSARLLCLRQDTQADSQNLLPGAALTPPSLPRSPLRAVQAPRSHPAPRPAGAGVQAAQARSLGVVGRSSADSIPLGPGAEGFLFAVTRSRTGTCNLTSEERGGR